MNDYLSKKIKILSLIAMMLVVLLHSVCVDKRVVEGVSLMANNNYNSFIQFFFSYGVTRIAVPLFFLISGYLFFRNITGKWSEFKNKYKSRFFSLVIPYLLCSVLSLLAVTIINYHRTHTIFFSFVPLKHIMVYIFLDPIAFQLWFVRDLIVLVAFSPIIYYLVKRIKVLPIIFLFVWVFGSIYLEKPVFVVHGMRLTDDILSATTFFVCGAYFAIHNQPIVLKQKASMMFFYLWIVVLLIKTTLLSCFVENVYLINVLHQLSIIIGVVGVWNMYDFVAKKINNNVLQWTSQYTFIIYVFHGPYLLDYLQRLIINMMNQGQFANLVAYFGSVIGAIIVSVAVGYCLKKTIPSFYKILTGNR